MSDNLLVHPRADSPPAGAARGAKAGRALRECSDHISPAELEFIEILFVTLISKSFHAGMPLFVYFHGGKLHYWVGYYLE